MTCTAHLIILSYSRSPAGAVWSCHEFSAGIIRLQKLFQRSNIATPARSVNKLLASHCISLVSGGIWRHNGIVTPSASPGTVPRSTQPTPEFFNTPLGEGNRERGEGPTSSAYSAIRREKGAITAIWRREQREKIYIFRFIQHYFWLLTPLNKTLYSFTNYGVDFGHIRSTSSIR